MSHRDDTVVVVNENNNNTGNIYYKILFAGNLNHYEKISSQYAKYWCNIDPCLVLFENYYCLPCTLTKERKGKEILDFYYSCAPLTPDIVLDAATVLILSVNDEQLIKSLHPYMIIHHFFTHCCFTNNDFTGADTDSCYRENQKSHYEKNDLNYSQLFIHTMSTYWCYDQINFRRLCCTINRISEQKKCNGKCGSFKLNIDQVSMTRKYSSKNVIFAGETTNKKEKNNATKEIEDAKNYSDKRLIISQDIISNFTDTDEKDDEKDDDIAVKTINVFQCFRKCKLCSILPLTLQYQASIDWEQEYTRVAKKLVGANIMTNIKETLNEFNHSSFLQGVTTCEMYDHMTRDDCRYNRNRFIQFFNTFSDVKKIANPVSVKHLTDMFLKERQSLLCTDLYFAICLERIMCDDKNVYNDKLSKFIEKVYAVHFY